MVGSGTKNLWLHSSLCAWQLHSSFTMSFNRGHHNNVSFSSDFTLMPVCSDRYGCKVLTVFVEDRYEGRCYQRTHAFGRTIHHAIFRALPSCWRNFIHDMCSRCTSCDRVAPSIFRPTRIPTWLMQHLQSTTHHEHAHGRIDSLHPFWVLRELPFTMIERL